jgi:uroporphyrinogen-III synthase
MRVVVTRPEPDAGHWVQSLQARGIEAIALPLIDILPVSDRAPLRAAWQRIGAFAAVMFVSGNAVQHFFAARPAGAPMPSCAWATGPGTTQALRAAGMPEAGILCPRGDAAQLDSEALWERARPLVHAGDRVLIVRGADAAGQPTGRDWLAERLAEAGAVVDTVAAYRRAVPAWSTSQHAAALEAVRSGAVWLLSSSEGVGNLQQVLPGVDLRAASAIASHPRIADAARRAGFGEVRQARPELDAMVASIESAR